MSNLCPNQRNVLAVTLHRQLLQICRESLEILLVGQDRNRFGTEEVGVPDCQEAHEHRQVMLVRRGDKVHVHLMEAV